MIGQPVDARLALSAAVTDMHARMIDLAAKVETILANNSYEAM